ncbi:MAG: hypothetical protein M0Z61_16905 [Nitrospiraceae bacterium]|nr:hypothetical protein [Nitrospiraceae bacterium]
MMLAPASAGGDSTLMIKRGTRNPLAPPFEYVKEVFMPMLGRLGISARAEIVRYGFYHKSGGAVKFL